MAPRVLYSQRTPIKTKIDKISYPINTISNNKGKKWSKNTFWEIIEKKNLKRSTNVINNKPLAPVKTIHKVTATYTTTTLHQDSPKINERMEKNFLPFPDNNNKMKNDANDKRTMKTPLTPIKTVH